VLAVADAVADADAGAAEVTLTEYELVIVVEPTVYCFTKTVKE
jgi:hypothetical protein